MTNGKTTVNINDRSVNNREGTIHGNVNTGDTVPSEQNSEATKPKLSAAHVIPALISAAAILVAALIAFFK